MSCELACSFNYGFHMARGIPHDKRIKAVAGNHDVVILAEVAPGEDWLNAYLEALPSRKKAMAVNNDRGGFLWRALMGGE